MSLDDLFSKLAMSTVHTVSRIALSHATNAAIRNVTSYLANQASPKNTKAQHTRDIALLQRQLDLKMKNLKPAVDRVSYGVANGNTELEPTQELCEDLQRDIDQFVKDTEEIEDAALLLTRLQRLLKCIDDVVPFLHLALRSIDPAFVSPSKLMQASRLLNANATPSHKASTSSFTITMYSLFAANAPCAARPEWECTWKEEARKAHLHIVRASSGASSSSSSSSDAFAYDIVISEDWDDGLYHNDDDGAKERTWRWPVDRVDRLFYTQASQLLRIDNQTSSPVLVIKMRKKAAVVPPASSSSSSSASSSPAVPPSPASDKPGIDVKTSNPNVKRADLHDYDWYAVQLYEMDTESDSDATSNNDNDKNDQPKAKIVAPPPFPMTLILLESVLKLALLESQEQMSHLQASDDLLSLYMASKK
ncbi:RanGTP-binding protein-domain-containing protein [Gongronella butleri]|nr:RanGTP-binding protein-domain-containing protein [Gongronella butleri]